MLLNNIKKSNYFVKLCNEIKDWTALVDEIYYKVEHMEPWAVGTHEYYLMYCVFWAVVIIVV